MARAGARSRAARGIAVLTLVLGAGLVAPPAAALGFADQELYVFPDGLALEAGDAPLALGGIPGLVSLSSTHDATAPGAIDDPESDYVLRIEPVVLGDAFVSGPGNVASVSASNVNLFEITFSVAWKGTVDGVAAALGAPHDFLFTFLGPHLGPGNRLLDPKVDAGYVRGSFDAEELVVSDASPGLINDAAGDAALAIRLPLLAPDAAPGSLTQDDLNFVSFSFQMALREQIFFEAGDEFQHINQGFLVSVPEPKIALLAASGLVLGVGRMILAGPRAR